MQRRLCVMSEAKWSITEAKCLQISHNKYASQRDAISPPMDNLMLSHYAGMHNTHISIAGISKRFHFASLHYIFSAYLPTHIKSLWDFLQSSLNIWLQGRPVVQFQKRKPISGGETGCIFIVYFCVSAKITWCRVLLSLLLTHLP